MAAEKNIERNYIIGFNKVIGKYARFKRATKAINYIKKFMKKHYKAEPDKVIISNKLNNLIWADGREHIPRKIEVKTIKDKSLVRVMLPNEEFKAVVPKKEIKPKETKETKEAEAQKELVKSEQGKKLEEKRIKEAAAEGRAFKSKQPKASIPVMKSD